jgi:hypothetical protein
MRTVGERKNYRSEGIVYQCPQVVIMRLQLIERG